MSESGVLLVLAKVSSLHVAESLTNLLMFIVSQVSVFLLTAWDNYFNFNFLNINSAYTKQFQIKRVT